MKKIYSLIAILAFVTLVFSACKKEAAAPVVQNITGNWKPDHVVSDYYFGNTSIATENNTDVRSYVDQINFKSDGTGEMIVDGKVLRDFKYEVSDSKIHCSSVFEHHGNTIVAISSFMYFITEFNGSQMAFTLDEYYYTSPILYIDKQVDRISRHIHMVKQ